MKTLVLSVGLFFFVMAISFSQGRRGGANQENREKIKAQKVAFITSKLELNADEAQLFWPVYNEYQKKLEDISSGQKKNHEGGKE